ncbi:MAG TPA: TIGR01777 family oxidoreductase [Fimbriimonadaceae bacterium]|nr:TIGR01777 family oxidoreductase [Fimbriimonadaceae bacterium]
MKYVIAGASGFIGSALCARLKLSGHEVVALSRRPDPLENVDRVRVWDGRTSGDWIEELETADVLVNLCGRSIACKWTPENRHEIIASRAEPTAILAEACRLVSVPPKAWINSSGIGAYQLNLEEPLGEDGPLADGFMREIGDAWEGELFDGDLPGCRRIALRTGVVLGHGGAYLVFEKLVKRFLGGSAGSGRQWMSWIHIEDLVSMVEWASIAPVEGPLNAVSPNPVRNREFMSVMRKVYGRPWSPPAPGFMIRLYGMLGGPDPSLVLDGNRVVPTKALAKGFEFRFPELEGAVRDLAS